MTLHRVYYHVGRHGQSAVFEDDGSAAMKFAMNLTRMGYPCRVLKQKPKKDAEETVYESDDPEWRSLHEHRQRIENGEAEAQPNYEQ